MVSGFMFEKKGVLPLYGAVALLCSVIARVRSHEIPTQ